MIIYSYDFVNQKKTNKRKYPITAQHLINEKLSYRRDSARCGDLRPLNIIRCCANRRGIYDFLLALN